MNQSINQLNEEFVLRLCKPSTRQQWLDSGVHYLCQHMPHGAVLTGTNITQIFSMIVFFPSQY